MAMIDTYKNNLTRKRQEIVKLSSDKAKESGKIQPLKAKIISAKSAISRSKQTSTIKSKLSEIERHEKSLAAIDKNIARIEGKIAAKEKEIAAEEKKILQEQNKIDTQRIKAEESRLKTYNRRMESFNHSLQQQNDIQTQLADEIEQLKYVPEKITVLFFATNPHNTDRLRLDEEVRSIQEMIRKSEHRDSIIFESRWAVRPLDILQAINELNPDVVHFSGHGASTGDLVLENADGTAKVVSKEAITQTIMTSSDKIHLLFFNACFSFEQAQFISEYVDAAIGMTTSIGDKAAVAFAAQFYSSLGFGFPVQKAFEQAKGVLMLESPNEKDTPALYLKDGVDANILYIVRPNSTN
ncbi:CHAT domain-containing protein [Acetobacterium wieringae]|uniref:CHAT domain-containing protein n=1 Tax=Acetobacterium wieringae TaxID=52694 RepID=UPI0026E99DE8|nr:CHAT domain-containing protein [Acetobacterium wieringae]